ncbi:hypothetical protein [Conexibacter sp. SYSU D00693]|uniref:hypothetical protein n=1 Tax=Conexibacter sp. SYSU D00693 TaxID=2812560 RepID=UPI00196B4876|nr:hypothetical protein [Conexibacter sp. SYSU D00693]
MHGAVYGVLLLAVVLVVGLVINPIVAVVLIALVAVVAAMGGLGGFLRSSRVATGASPSGVPTTREASYDPVRTPDPTGQ